MCKRGATPGRAPPGRRPGSPGHPWVTSLTVTGFGELCVRQEEACGTVAGSWLEIGELQAGCGLPHRGLGPLPGPLGIDPHPGPSTWSLLTPHSVSPEPLHPEASPSPKPVQLGDRSRGTGGVSDVQPGAALQGQGDWTQMAVRWDRAADPRGETNQQETPGFQVASVPCAPPGLSPPCPHPELLRSCLLQPPSFPPAKGSSPWPLPRQAHRLLPKVELCLGAGLHGCRQCLWRQQPGRASDTPVGARVCSAEEPPPASSPQL